jgi:hypothetical protein
MGYTHEDLLAEAQRRGLNIGQIQQPQYSRDDLLAEAKRRGLQVPEQSTGSALENFANSTAGKAFTSIGYGLGQLEHDIPVDVANLAIRGLHTAGLKMPLLDKAKISEDAPYPGLAKAAEIGGSIAIPIPGGGKIRALGEGGRALAKALASIGDNAATGAIANSVFSASDKNKSTGQNILEGAALGQIGTALEGILKAPGALTTSKMQNLAEKASPGGIKSPQQAAADYQKILPLLSDAKIDLGSLINDKKLSRFYNEKLKNTYGAGSNVINNQQQLLANTNTEADSILQRMLGKSNPIDAAEFIKSKIANLKQTREAEAKDTFTKILDSADSLGAPFPGWNKAKDYAKNILADEDEVIASGVKGELKKELKRVAGTDKDEAEATLKDMLLNPAKYTAEDLNKLRPQTIGNKSNATNNADYSKAHFSHSNIGRMANELSAGTQYRAADVAHGLQSAMHEDIENALKNSGAPDLYNAWTKAREDFKYNVAPLRESSLNKILKDEKDVNQLANTLLADKNKNVLNQLDQETKDLIVFEHLRGGLKDGTITPQRLLAETNKLNNSRKLGIADADILSRLDALNRLNNKLPEAKIANNPTPTGLRNKENEEKISKLALLIGGSALKPAAVAGWISGKYALDKSLEKLLTSDFLRNAYINQGVKTPQIKTQALIRALANLNSGGNQ